ncbi:MAG TPA: protein phosphatase 2C domain-containing protein [Polyangiaceae bacterium]
MSTNVRTSPHHVECAGATDSGKDHATNADAYVICVVGRHDEESSLPVTEDLSFDTNGDPLLLAVSDGVGAAVAGGVASAMVVESLRRAIPTESADWNRTLEAAFARANRDVWLASRAPEHVDSQATLVAVCVHGHDAYVAEVGDSRVYLLRNDDLQLVTRDRDYVGMQLDTGTLPAAVSGSMRDVVVDALGQKADVRVGLGRLRLVAGDTLLLCSDGLSDALSRAQIHRAIEEASSPREACLRLVQEANDENGKDNVTVIVASVH